MTLVVPAQQPKEQCALATLPPASSPPAPAGVAPQPCAGCVKLHQDIKQSVQLMMEKFDLLYMRMESLIREKEENRSESGSEKDIPSPSDSRSSPSLVQGSRKRKPQVVTKQLDNLPIKKEESAVVPTTAIPTAATATANISPPDFGFNSMDAVNQQQQQLLQFIMQQGMQQNIKAEVPEQTNSAQTIMEQLQQQFKDKYEDEENNASVSRCSNCMTTKTTAWRRDLAGKLVCNACGLYYRLHRAPRPIHLKKDFIQQRFRRKTKEEESAQQNVMFQQLLGMAAGQMAPNPAAFTFLEQFNQMHNAQEQLNTSAPV